MKDLHGLMRHIAAVWVCDPSRYPALAGTSEEQRKKFLLNHSILHIDKTKGKVAAILEDFDHTGRFTPGADAELKELAIKSFVNVLKLAEESGVSAQELLARAPDYVN